ncbi:rna polymerase ii mediator complex subunit [Diaporthe amygdali]|uniref:rna polymerase ii mediator complex subunit n=1 Tax=Phomopsis amygdali TaxID=1214568 RepID=UPI0022FF41D8|nr:rna polymerase ii mediator complex subunit [Diaporthe amygdali]KAJ0124766.1 rna polymerase ii mediator complex subunit [Diaporthe amygdali]
MYELFLTAFINDVDFDNARSILSSYCWSDPSSRIYRVFHFAGPAQPRALAKRNNINGIRPAPDPFMFGLPGAEPLQAQMGPYIDQGWKELSDIVKKQSYIVTVRYEVSKTSDFGGTGPHKQLTTTPGALFWTEIPDPASVAGGQSLVMQRKKIEIWDQLNLPTVLNENDFRFKAQLVEETHDIYHRDDPLLEFSLVRHYTPPASFQGPASGPLPAFEELDKVDSAGKWTLWVRYHVHDDSAPEKIKAARDALLKARDDLAPCGFDFKVLDRKVFDTQLMLQRKTPATQTLGLKQSLAPGHR